MNYSYSRLSLYDRCPRKFQYKYVDKLDIDTDSPIFEKGKFFHSIIENYPQIPEWEFKYQSNKDNAEAMLQQIRNFCDTDKKIKYLLSDKVIYGREQQFYLDADLNNCNEEDQLINGIIDYVGTTGDTVLLCDWKSGKTQKYASFEQLKLYSIWAFNNFPEINTVKTMLFFIEQDVILSETFQREAVVGLKQKVLTKIADIENSKLYNKKVKEDCQYCDYIKICEPFKVKKL